jgi:Leucine Rich repeat
MPTDSAATSEQQEIPTRKRRWFQFSLRALMIAVTLLCVAMSVVSSQASRQRRAVERIKAVHGIVDYGYQLDAELRPRTDDPAAPGPDWLRNLIGIDYFATATAVRVNLGSDELLAAAGELPHLRLLQVACISNVSDRGLEHIEGLAELETLYLASNTITNAGLEQLKGMTHLHSLYLRGTGMAVTDAGLTPIKGLTQLRTLSLVGTHVSAAGVKDLVKALPNCKVDQPKSFR